MKIVDTIFIENVQRHERYCNTSVPLGSLGMDIHCPLDEFKAYKVTLEANDIDKLFLLNCGFIANTYGHTGKLRDINYETLSDVSTSRVNSFMALPTQSGKHRVELHSSPQLALVLVSANIARGPWVIMDGNHRAIAQYLMYGNVCNVPAYVCVHSRINQWPYFPRAAGAFSDFS